MNLEEIKLKIAEGKLFLEEGSNFMNERHANIGYGVKKYLVKDYEVLDASEIHVFSVIEYFDLDKNFLDSDVLPI
tara:strand:+ start:1118 stop:1342 length:225 start_codon:yes stop_codon:yes gene_type:complete